jgi:hypothetical protein
MLIIPNNKVVLKAKGVIEEITNNYHLDVVQKFFMGIFFFLDKLSGLFVNYSVNDLENKKLSNHKTLLVDKLLTITDLDPIRRYLAPSDRPKPNSRYSSIQVNIHFQFSFSFLFVLGFIAVSIYIKYTEINDPFSI